MPRRFGSKNSKSEGSNKNTDDISNGVFKGSTRRAEITEMIGGFFSGAGEERNDGSDGNGVAAEERVRGEISESVEEKSNRETHDDVVEFVCA